jgi:hypothetical protein
MLRNYQVATQLVASGVVLSSTELVCLLVSLMKIRQLLCILLLSLLIWGRTGIQPPGCKKELRTFDQNS